jgi:inhibitor of cysteine peptidase
MKQKTQFRLFLILTAALFVLVGCSPAQVRAKTVTLTEADAGKTIELQNGNLLVVVLDGNITTGFNWEMVPQTPAVLEQLGEPEATPDSSALGAGGKISLKFQAVQTGQASLTLIYHRSFEKDVPPEKTFEVTILVK